MADGRRVDLGHGDSKGKYSRRITSPIWQYGIVTSVDDKYDAGRIKVRLFGPSADGLDDDVPYSLEGADFKKGGLPWCEPLMPKFLNVVPKVGEMVKVVTFDYRNKKLRRQYIGPVIGQQTPIDLENSSYHDANIKVENGTYTTAWSLNTEASDGDWKIYPDKTDIGILGRKNTDIILRDASYYDEVILRAGKINSSTLKSTVSNNKSPYTLNKVNPAYISINFTQASALQNVLNPDIRKLNLQNDRAHVNVVADKINLISHAGSSKKGYVRSILKGEDIVTQIKTENEKLHPLPYGDVLWDFLNVLRPYVESHIHKASRREPDGDITKNNLIKWFNDNMGTVSEKQSPDGTKYKEIINCGFLSKGVKTN